MKHIIIIVAIGLALFLPKPAYACSGFIDCLLGISEGAEIRNESKIEIERIQAAGAVELARVEAEATARVSQAEQSLELIKQGQYKTEADRDMAIAAGQARVEEYKAMIRALTDEKIAGIQSNADTQIQALQGQADIAIAGINQTGTTERYRIAGSWAFSIIALLIVGYLVALYMARSRVRVRIEQLPAPELNWVLPKREGVKYEITRD